jgi:hypothetical protein
LHSEGNADRCYLHRRGIVYAIAKEQRRGLRRLLADDRNLVLGTLGRIQFHDPHLFGQVPYFLVAVARNDQNMVDRMAWA